jgi:hypothetical protein
MYVPEIKIPDRGVVVPRASKSGPVWFFCLFRQDWDCNWSTL